MAKDVLITPASGLIQFKDTGGNVDATIQLNDSNVLNITGTISLGDLAADVYIGDGVNEVDIVFEQNGIIYGQAGKTLTLGQANSYLSIAANITSGANVTGNIVGGNITSAGLISAATNIIAGTDLYVGSGATTAGFTTAPIIVGRDSSSTYTQVAIQNASGAGSADITTYANNGTETQGWMDMGITGNAFTDTNYTITGSNDGYLFAQGNASFGGNLVLSTGNIGTTRDIVFGFGFLAANEFLRLQRSTNTILPYANTTANIGSTTKYLNNLYASNIVGTTVTTTGNVISSANVSGANLVASANLVSVGAAVSGNITGGNLLTAGRVIATGNVQSSANITGANLVASAAMIATGNITGGNLITAGQVVATGNVTSSGNVAGTYLLGNVFYATGFSASKIYNGTSEINIGTSGGAANISIGGTSNVAVFSSTGVAIIGDLSVSGNATLSGNILGDRLQNGTTSIDIQTASGNANVSVAGTSNVVVFSSTGQNVTGYLTTSGNITGGNLLTAGLVSATGNITSVGNISGSYLLGNGSQLTGIVTGNSFGVITVSGQSDVVADQATDTLTLAAGTGIAITTDASTDTITISSAATDSIFATGGDMGTVTETVTSSEDLGAVTSAATIEYDLGTETTSGIVTPSLLLLPSYTVSQLGSLTAAPAGQFVYCTNESGGAIPAFSDGTNWRRVSDRAIVS